MIPQNIEDANKQFNALKLHDNTIKRVWDSYQYGDIGSYQEALKHMVILLVEEKRDLSRRLLQEIQNRKLL